MPTAIRGVIWYQGESNAQEDWRVDQHNLLFPLLVKDWRKQWDRKDMPVLFVQLPAMGRPHWPDFREGQRRMLAAVANSGMAITLDVGHPTNVHPKKKQPVGERLARWALGTTYGKDIVVSGPLVRHARVVGQSIRVEFDHTGQALNTTDGESPRGFEVAGSDGVFHPAAAAITGRTLVVTSEQVSAPRHIRYAWLPVPKAINLVNSDNLPASPFEIEVASP